MNAPRRHHYVPEYYLRGFSPFGSPGKVFVYDKEIGACFGTSVKNVAVKRDYYRLDGAKVFGEDPLVLEKYLAGIEGRAARLPKRLISGADLQGQDRMDWAEFLATMLARGPNARQMFAEISSLMALQMTDVATASKERYEAVTERMKSDGYELKTDVGYEEFRKFLTERNFEVSVDEQFTLSSFSAVEKTAPIFFDMRWAVIKSVPQSFFLTSDTPIIYGSPAESYHPVYGDGGLVNKKVEVLFPLSRRAIFVGAWRAIPQAEYLPKSLADKVNKQLIEQAFRYVYAPIESAEIFKFSIETQGANRRIRNPELPKVTVKRSVVTE